MAKYKIRNICIITIIVATIVAINIDDVDAKMSMVQIRNAVKPAARKCQIANKVDDDLLERARRGDVAHDRGLACYYSCILKAMKVLGKDDKINLDIIRKQTDLMMTPDIVGPSKAIAEKCYNEITSEESCEMSWEFAKCYYDTDMSLCLFP